MRYLLGFVIVALVSCRGEQLSPAEAVRFIESEESGLRRVVAVGESRMEVQYLPGKYWEAKGLLTGKEYPAVHDSFASFRIYFSNDEKTSSLSRHSSSSKTDYLDRLQYLDGDARYDFLFKQAGDTSLSAMYHYERTYDMVPFDCVNISFPLSGKPEEEFVLEYHDNMFLFGIQKFLFDEEVLKRIENIELVKK